MTGYKVHKHRSFGHECVYVEAESLADAARIVAKHNPPVWPLGAENVVQEFYVEQCAQPYEAGEVTVTFYVGAQVKPS